MSRLLQSRCHLPSRRFFTSTAHRGAFATGPAPPRLPPKEQEEFERLQRASTGAFSTPQGQTSKLSEFADSLSSGASTDQPNNEAKIADEAVEKKEELHPDYRKGAKPEFEGDVNPKTGEVGGPKNNPLRWGGEGDWSYNGRVTDF